MYDVGFGDYKKRVSGSGLEKEECVQDLVYMLRKCVNNHCQWIDKEMLLISGKLVHEVFVFLGALERK